MVILNVTISGCYVFYYIYHYFTAKELKIIIGSRDYNGRIRETEEVLYVRPKELNYSTIKAAIIEKRGDLVYFELYSGGGQSIPMDRTGN